MTKYFKTIKGQGGHTNEYFDYLLIEMNIKGLFDLEFILKALGFNYNIIEPAGDKLKKTNKYDEISICSDLSHKQFSFYEFNNTYIKIELDKFIFSISISGKEGYDSGWGNLTQVDFDNAEKIESLIENADLVKWLK